MEMKNDLVLGQGIHISPRLIQSNHMLSLSSLELQQFIRQETYENPALEVSEEMVCPACGSILVDLICHACVTPRDTPEPSPSDASEAYDNVPMRDYTLGSQQDDTYDPLLHVATDVPFRDRLLVELELHLEDPRDQPVAEFLVGSLDDNGWLRCSVSEAAQLLGVEVARVERVLCLLQALEPIGSGARDLRECLLIQLAYLEGTGHGHPYVREIITDHFDAMAGHKYKRIARALKVPVEDVVAACRFVHDHLTPFPAQQGSGAPGKAPADTPRYLLPDVIISRGEDDNLVVSTVESKRIALNISPHYQQIYQAAEAPGAGLSERDREHVRHYVSRARRFLSNLEQRRQTMQKIGECVAAYQREYVLHGVRYLKPLTRAVVAALTGMHESTVSRATAGKYVMVPDGRVIPFGDFFTPALGAKDVLKSLVSQETAPLDDQELAERLRDHGHYLARRTVAKYRDELGILPSALRR